MIWWSLRLGLLIGALFAGALYALDASGRLPRSDMSAASQGGSAATRPAAEFGSELKIRPSADGHYYVDAVVNSTRVRFLVDTGATSIMLSPEDAARVGARPAQHEYTRAANTANGVIRLAPVTMREVRVGGFTTYDVEALVSQAPSHISLLGMSFLKRLEGWEVRGNQLYLRW